MGEYYLPLHGNFYHRQSIHRLFCLYLFEAQIIIHMCVKILVMRQALPGPLKISVDILVRWGQFSLMQDHGFFNGRRQLNVAIRN